MPRKAVDGAVRMQSLNLKTTQELRDKMEKAAAESGRALTHEVEARLNRSFEYDYLMGESETALVVRAIGAAVRRFEVTSGKQWTEDKDTQEAAFEAVTRIVDVIMRPRPVEEAFVPNTVVIDPNDKYMRLGLKTMALDRAMEELRTYRNLKEKELIDLRPTSPR